MRLVHGRDILTLRCDVPVVMFQQHDQKVLRDYSHNVPAHIQHWEAVKVVIEHLLEPFNFYYAFDEDWICCHNRISQ